MKKILIALVCIYMLGCETKPDPISTEFATLKSEVIEIHDVAMAKMGDMVTLKKQLINELDSTVLDSTYLSAVADLEIADDEMISWMRDFSNAFTVDQLANGLSSNFETDEERAEAVKALETLNTHKESAIEMKKQMESAISNAQALLSAPKE